MFHICYAYLINVSYAQNENRCVPFVPSHMIYTSLKTSDYFSTLYDCQGDSYTDDVTEEDLRNIFQSITDKVSMS